MRASITLYLLTFTTIIFAQEIKSLDYIPLFKKNHVQSRLCEEIIYKMNRPVDTLKISSETFDELGRIKTCTEYFAGGRIFAIYEFGYNEKNELIQCFVQHTFNDFVPVECIIILNDQQKIASLQLKESIRNFWSKETFTYNTIGLLIKVEKWYDEGGVLKVRETDTFPSSLQPRDNSLTYIHDQRGLLILHQFYTSGGMIERSRKFQYQ